MVVEEADMRANVKRVENELVVALPTALVEAAGLSEGTSVNVRVDRGSLLISPRDPTLKELLDQINGPPPPGIWDDVEPKGTDVW